MDKALSVVVNCTTMQMTNLVANQVGEAHLKRPNRPYTTLHTQPLTTFCRPLPCLFRRRLSRLPPVVVCQQVKVKYVEDVTLDRLSES